MNNINKLRRLMYAAHYLKKQAPVILRGATFTQKGALKHAWWFEHFRKKLSTGIYRFSYFKKDGGIREAVGTLDPALIPDDILPKSGMDPDALAPASTFHYYDLDANGWRSFLLDLFIGFIEEIKE